MTYKKIPKFRTINWIKHISVSGMCTGSFSESGRPLEGTKCAHPCVMDSGKWGSSYCYTEEDKSQWGAECVLCGKNIDSFYIE